jgi:hypothetical protein
MANFLVITGEHGYERINLDAVRHITEDMEGQITVHFDLTHGMRLNGENSRHVMSEIDKAQKAAALI